MTVSFIKVTVILIIMVTTEKPKGIMITIRDRKENASKTLTVYGTTLEEVYDKIKEVLEKE
jgi:hypothetical protein